MAEQTRRVPPHSADAERAVLGAMMKRDQAFAQSTEKLAEEDFYLPSHRLIFAAMEELHMQAKPIDEVTMIDYLERRGLLKEAGGFTYITDLPQMVPVMGNLGYYIGIVEEKSTLRKLIAACEDTIGNCYDSGDELDRVLALAEKSVFDVSLKDSRSALRRIGEDAVACYNKLGERSVISGLTGLATGFTLLDTKLSGLQKSDLIVVAARPAMGKTSFAMNIAQYAALHEGATVAIFSLEMSREQLITRLLCTQAEVDMQHVKSGQLSNDWERIADALLRVTQSNLYIDDTAGITIAEISSKLRRLKLESGRLDLVVIDYLQLMTYRGKADNRQQEISETTRSLKILARDVDVPIILLSQLSRAPEQRADHEPILSDLRESGAIEQDADIVMFLYRPAVYDSTEDGSKAQVDVAKHRNGPTGKIPLLWKGEFTKFEDSPYGYE